MHEFLAIDRCDACGARAAHIATKAGKASLLFCSHHHDAHRDKLLGDYWLIESDVSPAEPVPASAYTES